MLDTIGAFGSGIGTNLLSDSLSKKLEAFKDKKAIASFTQSLRDWEIEFEKQNDGTIITNGAFYTVENLCQKHYRLCTPHRLC